MTTDPDAPWGRTETGQPKRKPGPPKGRRTGAPPAPGRTPPRAPARAQRPDYRQSVFGLIQMIALPLGIAGAQTGSVPLKADAAALALHAEPLADGVQIAAEQDPRMAAILDRLLKAGPYAALMVPTLALLAQLGVNHGLLPLGLLAQIGVMPPEVLISVAAGEPIPDPTPPPAPAGPAVPEPREPEPDPVV